MGAGNVKLTYARWAKLPDLPFRLLVYMALVSMDADEAPTYWGGWEPLALAAGRLVPERNDADKQTVKVRRAALKAVSTAVGVLLERGALKVKVPAAPGRHASYSLIFAYESVHVDREPSDSPPDGNGSRLPDTTVHAEPTNGSRSPARTVHAESAPEEYEEEVRTKPRNESADLRTDVTGPRVRDAAEEPIFTGVEKTPHLRLVTDEEPRPYYGRRWSSRGQDVIAEAMARRAAARAANQNAGEAS